MRIHRILLLSIFIPAALAAQPFFTGLNELRVSSKPVDNIPPSIAVDGSGALWVVWSNGSQLIRDDLTLDSRILNAPGGGSFPEALGGGNWGKIDRRDSCFDTPLQGCWQLYRLAVYSPQKIVDSSLALYATWNVRTSLDGDSDNRSVYLLNGFSESGRSALAVNFHAWSGSGSFFSTSAPRLVETYDLTTRSRREVYSSAGDWYLGESPFFDKLRQAKTYGIPICVLSPPRGGKFAILERAMQLGSANTPVNPGAHQRVAKLFTLSGDSLSSRIPIDSVQTEETDLSDRILLGSENDCYIIRRRAPSDTLLIERFSLDGTRLSPPCFFLDKVRLQRCITYPGMDTLDHNKRADLTVVALPDENWLTVWGGTRPGGGTDVYAALFDRHFVPLGIPKRVNSDSTGDQYAPSVALKGDTIFMAWIDARNGQRHVYLRRCGADQILGTERTETPSAFGIDAVYPQPARESVSITYSLPTDPAEGAGFVSVYDALGRIVRRQPFPEGTGAQGTIRLRTDSLPSGVYMAALNLGPLRKSARILVVR